jgi:hypothetical protein
MKTHILIPSTVASRHLLPEGEGYSGQKFRCVKVPISRNYMFHDYRHLLEKPLFAKYSCFCLGFLIVWHFIYLITHAIPSPAPLPPIPIKTKTATIVFLKTPLFGQDLSKELNHEDIKPSMLNIKIEGVIFSTNESESSAILKTEHDPAQTYHVGDTILGAMIKQITPEGILLMRNGTLERLNLPKNELIFEPIDSDSGI